MPSTNSPVLQSGPDSGQRRKREAHTAFEKHHAKELAEYIVAVLESGELLMEGVEPSWVLGSCHSKSISFGKWLKFQRLFMIQWPSFVRKHGHDRFWVDKYPPFMRTTTEPISSSECLCHSHSWRRNSESEQCLILQLFGGLDSLYL